MAAFTNRIALVTGAGNGIGRALSLELARQGASIAGVDLSADALRALAGQLPAGRFAWQVADVTDRAALGPAVAKLAEQLGPIDLLIANAGVGTETAAVGFRAEEFERIVRVNLLGVSNSIELVLPGMIERKSGHLVAISSLASFRGLPRMAAYCASKAGVNALMDAMRVELREHGITVTTICPGWIRTALTQQVDVPMPGLMEPDEAARQILRAVERRVPFHAFPAPTARRVRLAGMLPCGVSDWLVFRMLRRMGKD